MRRLASCSAGEKTIRGSLHGEVSEKGDETFESMKIDAALLTWVVLRGSETRSILLDACLQEQKGKTEVGLVGLSFLRAPPLLCGVADLHSRRLICQRDEKARPKRRDAFM